MVSDTASGTIASFTDGSDVLPAKSVLVTLEPKQSGSGTPSPSNIRPISGWDEVETVVSPTQSADDGTTYQTTLPQTVYGGTLDVVSGVLTVDRAMRVLDGSTDETWSVQPSSGHYRAYTYALSDIKPHSSNTQPTSAICNMYETGTWNNVFNGQPYLGQTGKAIGIGVDGLGITDVTTWVAWLADNPIEVVYPLATPTTIQCDPQTVHTLIGDNNVWGGDGVSIDYYADTKLYIEKMLGA